MPQQVHYKVVELHASHLMCVSVRAEENPALVASWANLVYTEIEPIPLSEEWLKRMGFIKESFSDQYRLGPRLLIKRKHGFYDYGSNVLLKHVHRLQNFWYELEGSELTINL